ncbi:MAG: MBL fold metallo-hydrolase [Endomicrobium sp.]|nr:MBL fold metallo-hydrolase [Endomicrobium sp.]
MSLNFCILSSGSSGNCSVIWTEKATILIDCGCSIKYITKNLSNLGISTKNLTATVITHGHTDHMSPSVFSLLFKNNIPIYLHKDVFEDLFRKYGKKIEKCTNILFNKTFKIENIYIKPFYVHHKDQYVTRTFGFTFSSIVNTKEYKIGYITDTGKICNEIIKNLVNSNILIIESNYDEAMLESSLRFHDNKKWVSSDWGHLSNESAADAIVKIRQLSNNKENLKYVFLAHISKHHNNVKIAIDTTKKILTKNGISNISLFATKNKKRCPSIKII